MRVCHEGIGISLQSRVFSGHCGRNKTGCMVAARWYLPHIFRYVADMVMYCDVCHCMNTYKLQMGYVTLNSIPVPLKVWSQIGIDLIGPLKEIYSYKYIVTTIDYTSTFSKAKS